MRIPLLDLKAQYREIGPALEEAARKVLAGGSYILGEEVAALENELAEYCGTDCAVGVANGTDALMLVLESLSVGPGDEVITTPFTFFATAEVVARLGARTVFADIEWDTMNLDPAATAQALTDRTKAFMPVHLFGQTARMDEFNALAGERGLKVVEDACQAIGSRYRGDRAGSLGTAGCFSFFPTKNLGGYGDGGAVTTSDAGLAERIRALRAHGSRRKYYHDLVGLNSRLDELQAALLRVKLPYLDRWNRERQERAARYDRLLEGSGVTLPRTADGCECVYHLYVIRHPLRDRIAEKLKEAGIACGVYYPQPLHLAPALSHLGYREGDFPVAEECSRQALALPIYPELPEEHQEEIAAVVRKAVG